MNLEYRITAFCRLGDQLDILSDREFHTLFQKVLSENSWFTAENVKLALSGIRKFLNREVLTQWVNAYRPEPHPEKTIGVAMAGNIPLAGFHDFLCVLISGHRIKIKLSSQDSVLLAGLAERLIEIEPNLSNSIQFSDRLLDVDAVIATGSDNTARYFDYYFRNIPHIIRKNRTSCALLRGDETSGELRALGLDIFSYFGLGCRNVSKVLVPENYDFMKLFEAWEHYEKIRHHAKYFNNYEYQKSILLVNKDPFFDSGFILLKEDADLVSPVSVLYFEYYSDPEDLRKKMVGHAARIQCLVSARQWFDGSEALGMAQFPSVSDYPDKVDTLKFLLEL